MKGQDLLLLKRQVMTAVMANYNQHENTLFNLNNASMAKYWYLPVSVISVSDRLIYIYISASLLEINACLQNFQF